MLSAPGPTEYAKAQRALIKRITADSAFMTIKQLAEKHNLPVYTIRRKLKKQ